MVASAGALVSASRMTTKVLLNTPKGAGRELVTWFY